MSDTQRSTHLPTDDLRWNCPADALDFESTDDIEPIAGVIGQDSALEALRFGLACRATGQNIFVRGLSGTGRMTMVRRLLDELRPVCAIPRDRCYVHNFAQPHRPRLITLPPGRARELRRRMRGLAEFVTDQLGDALENETLQIERQDSRQEIDREIEALTGPLEAELRQVGLALVTLPGPVSQVAISPVIDGNAIPPDRVQQMRAAGDISDQDWEAFVERSKAAQPRVKETTRQVGRLFREGVERIRNQRAEQARVLLEELASAIHGDFPEDAVGAFLTEIVEDVIENHLEGKPADNHRSAVQHRYGVNVLHEHDSTIGCPVLVENNPTLTNLLGTIEPEWGAQGSAPADYHRIRSGSLLRSDGGYLILDVRDVLSEPGAWRVLIRTLRNKRLEIVPPEMGSTFPGQLLQPEPIPMEVRVILVGDSATYYALDQQDPDFAEQFKVLADFDHTTARSPEGIRQYASVLSRLAGEESLPPFHRSAIAELAEHGARVAARRGKLTTRFSRIADLAREAAFLTRGRGSTQVEGRDVESAVRRSKDRANLPSRRFRELMADGTIQVSTKGETVGQINGLAVMSAGPLTYGFPARITASIGPGTAGIIDIEGRASLSGSIHTKGFHILGGLLRNLLRTDHPLAFSASLAFEQSYGGIDGDSASGAETCALLSALTDLPIRQSFAMTGAIDQFGHIQAIGGVNEKVEGFFDVCAANGLTGEQGVIIPRSNAGDLMLRKDLVEACVAGQFHVHAVETIHQALELLTGVCAGERRGDGYPDDSLLGRAVHKAYDYWRKTHTLPTAE